MSYKKLFLFIVSGTCLILIFQIILTAFVDPFFHYHDTHDFLNYEIEKPRYQNNGILKHFDYEGLIIGTSMIQNMKATKAEKMYGVNFVKTAYSGASYKELADALYVAVENNDKLKYVIMSVDLDYMITDKDTYTYRLEEYPLYLYNDYLLDDVNYFFNKDILFEYTIQTLKYTYFGNKNINFDDYANQADKYEYNKEILLKKYERPILQKEIKAFSTKIKEKVYGNVYQNIITIAKENPDIEFYFFYPPYSILSWNNAMHCGKILRYIRSERLATELMLELDNIHVYSFWQKEDIITDLNNYRDALHYSQEVSDSILDWIDSDEGKITKENYEEYYDWMENYFMNYNYDSIFN